LASGAWLAMCSAALAQPARPLRIAVLNGTPPGDIPFEQSTKLELVINQRAFKALGLSVPASLRVSADEVIE
jgi:putative tryptophan/tyrosine transport system substrate-binding protein